MDYHISSSDNRIYKDCVRLGQRKHRDREGKYLIEGPNIVREALSCGAAVETVILREDVAEGMRPDALRGELPTGHCRIVSMDSRLFSKISQTETSQGMIAIVSKNRDAETPFQKESLDGGNLLVLDKLQDPGNIGTMIRTAEGAGYAGVICIKGTGDVYGPKTLRAAAGAAFRMPLLTGVQVEELPAMLRDLGMTAVVTAMDGVDYRKAELKKNIALIIGNEGNGVSPYLMEHADLRVSIPMKGRLESLNASVAAGILMYEAAR